MPLAVIMAQETPEPLPAKCLGNLFRDIYESDRHMSKSKLECEFGAWRLGGGLSFRKPPFDMILVMAVFHLDGAG